MSLRCSVEGHSGDGKGYTQAAVNSIIRTNIVLLGSAPILEQRKTGLICWQAQMLEATAFEMKTKEEPIIPRVGRQLGYEGYPMWTRINRLLRNNEENWGDRPRSVMVTRLVIRSMNELESRVHN